MSKTSFHAGVLATVSLLSGAAQAQQASDPVIALDELSVSGDGKAVSRGYQPVRSSIAMGSETPILKIPQAVAVVTEQALQDQGVRTLDEALYNVSGITQTNTLGGTQDAFIRRGFGDNRDGSILRDGLRTALPRSFMPTTQRVEVLKGPASALYGILDPGGLINIVTKTPRFVQAGYIEAFGTSFNGGGVEADLTGPIEGTNLAYRFIAQHRNAEYWRNFGTQNQQVVAPSVTWQGDATRVTLAYEWSHYKFPFDRGTIFDLRNGKPVNVPRDRRFDERYNITAGENHVASLNVEHSFDATWKANFNYAFSHNFYQDNQARVVSYNPATNALVRRADATQDSNFSVHSGRLDLTGKENFLGVEHDLLIGASYDYSDVLRTRLIRGPNSTTFNIFNPVYGRLPQSFAVSAVDSDQRERIETASVYAQDSISLTDQLIVVGGLRYQDFSQMAGKGRPFNTNTDVSGGRVVPRVGLVYLLTPSLSAYASYSQTFRPNSSIASFIGALPPEEGEAYEVGLKAELFEGITATAALYDITKANVLYTEVINAISYSRTAGKVNSRGFELDVAGQIAPDWSVIATYAYTDAVVTEDPTLKGNELLNVAPHTASVFLTHDFGPLGDGRLRAGLGGRYVGSRPGSAANTFRLPDYAVADAFIAYDTQVAGRPATVQLNLRNLTNETVYTSSIGTNLGVALGEPFQAIVSARLFW
ncbi:TonB-dependent siderophore receptor [Methylobacterium sp. J-090]|uniref:TonB-dependent siderophore receptor n=1 Tax=Methylobacterium sp. J-090 TaxID=2836666 RepID=UPI001FB9B1D3|nr:TonB-dependent siderophore receptor [Methylobacterium sp. J-090]MCJ2082476.1 TonB-dependent siderophore receptor [Methylobacterium sp. J-090]